MRKSSSIQIFGILIVICATVITGCGPSGRAPIAPASGVVKLGGKPVEGVKVTFLPLDGGAIFSHGTTDKDGKFTMSTYGLNDGALVGRHGVIVTKVDIEENKINTAELGTTGYGGAGYEQMMGPGSAKPDKAKQLLPKKYADQKTSGIEVSVEAGQDNDVPINLTP